jgi:hypothetical protein
VRHQASHWPEYLGLLGASVASKHLDVVACSDFHDMQRIATRITAYLTVQIGSSARETPRIGGDPIIFNGRATRQRKSHTLDSSPWAQSGSSASHGPPLASFVAVGNGDATAMSHFFGGTRIATVLSAARAIVVLSSWRRTSQISIPGVRPASLCFRIFPCCGPDHAMCTLSEIEPSSPTPSYRHHLPSALRRPQVPSKSYIGASKCMRRDSTAGSESEDVAL